MDRPIVPAALSRNSGLGSTHGSLCSEAIGTGHTRAWLKAFPIGILENWAGGMGVSVEVCGGLHFPQLLSDHFLNLSTFLCIDWLASGSHSFSLVTWSLMTSTNGTVISLVWTHMLKGLPLCMGAGNPNLGLHVSIVSIYQWGHLLV